MLNLKSASSNLLTCKVLPKKQKKFKKLGPKIPYSGIFGLQVSKTYYQNFNQHTRICETIKFHRKQKQQQQQQKKSWEQKMLYLGLWLEC